MINIPAQLSSELGLQLRFVQNALVLLGEGATVPFIARYRKERTGEMNELQLRALVERNTYLSELEARKETVLASIEGQGKLTGDLKARIEACLLKTDLEDLYLPFKPKKRTRATIAREKGLEPLAAFIRGMNGPAAGPVDLESEAAKYVSAESAVATTGEALQGASDILAEETSESAALRRLIRDLLVADGSFVSHVKDEFPAGTTKFEMYREYRVAVRDIAPHNMLALRRGETEGVLHVSIEFDEGKVRKILEDHEVQASDPAVREFYRTMLADAFERLMRTSLVSDVRLEKKAIADRESVRIFEANLRNLLLASPAGMKPTLGVDPGFRTGCKVAAVDSVGRLVEYATIHPHKSAGEREEAARVVLELVKRHKIELIAVGNGTAGRETEQFIAGAIESLDPRPVRVMVNEAGASVYSASDAAIEEFPELDLTIRGAISIARRLQDPLAELVKIDPKSIGVGQYQHDVDQKLLKEKLDETVESCVNYVGVDLNLASKELLRFVSGITAAQAKSIVAWRAEHGPFRSRQALLEVPRFGPKAFEHAAGFLRIRGGGNPLDNTAVHPESYEIVERIARDLGVPLESITRSAGKIRSVELSMYVTDTVGEPTLRDILSELEKPGRDPREEFRYASFREDVREIKDLLPGMELEGVVTNVANFGAFVDIGVHQDGLVHVSQLADRFVDDPKKVVRVGQIVRVRVLEVNEKLKRISLSMKSQKGGRKPPEPEQVAATIEDLKARFNTRGRTSKTR